MLKVPETSSSDNNWSTSNKKTKRKKLPLFKRCKPVRRYNIHYPSSHRNKNDRKKIYISSTALVKSGKSRPKLCLFRVCHVIPLKKINKEIKKTTLRWNFPQVLKVERSIDRKDSIVSGVSLERLSTRHRRHFSRSWSFCALGNVLVLRKPIKWQEIIYPVLVVARTG